MIQDFAADRHQMVEAQLRRRGLGNERLLAAFEQVPRHLFIPENLQYAAYADMPLPIGYNQTISQPYIVGLMTSLLELQGDESVLEVGTGSGYQAAILSRMAAHVETVELLPELGLAAEALLNRLGYHNVNVHIGDGSLGWIGAAPYPAILATAAAPSVPYPLLEQLAEGGRLVLPIAVNQDQLLTLFTKRGQEYREQVITAVAFVPMRGKFGWG